MEVISKWLIYLGVADEELRYPSDIDVVSTTEVHHICLASVIPLYRYRLDTGYM